MSARFQIPSFELALHVLELLTHIWHVKACLSDPEGIVRRWAHKALHSALMLLSGNTPKSKNRFDSKFGRSSETNLSVLSRESFDKGVCNLKTGIWACVRLYYDL